ncbi:MAG: exopolyphosphatase [Lachnospiraceae bacterium]|nr:exopolyphosphatase [Lachnospiraceae bacterium]
MADKEKKLFAAIDAGSFEISMKIFEIGPKGPKQLDHVRHRLALGNDSYNTKKISYEHMEELFRILKGFRQIMKSYDVTEYRAYGTSALRETENTSLLLDQILNRSGIKLTVLSNSEQRFLDYKAIASNGERFKKGIDGGAAIVDIGGGSIQISLFDKGQLAATQALKLGVLRINERLRKMQPKVTQMEEVLDEMIGSQLRVFKRMYMKDRTVERIILMDDYLSPVIMRQTKKDDDISLEDFMSMCAKFREMGREELANLLETPEENVSLLRISAAIIRRIMPEINAKQLWVPRAALCDGIVYEYLEEKKLGPAMRDFEQDIISSARALGKRYLGSRKRGEALEYLAVSIFDGMSEIHGMNERHRLLLRLATILHDCGKFINMTNVGACSYGIIMNTEIIGLSHTEREMLAYIVKFNHDEFEYYDELASHTRFDENSFMIIAKLTAILRIANALDKSQKQKIKSMKVTIQDDRLMLYTETGENLLFEQERFSKRADFFKEIFGLKPQIKRI